MILCIFINYDNSKLVVKGPVVWIPKGFPQMKGIVLKGVPDSNTKPPGRKPPTNSALVDVFNPFERYWSHWIISPQKMVEHQKILVDFYPSGLNSCFFSQLTTGSATGHPTGGWPMMFPHLAGLAMHCQDMLGSSERGLEMFLANRFGTIWINFYPQSSKVPY